MKRLLLVLILLAVLVSPTEASAAKIRLMPSLATVHAGQPIGFVLNVASSTPIDAGDFAWKTGAGWVLCDAKGKPLDHFTVPSDAAFDELAQFSNPTGGRWEYSAMSALDAPSPTGSAMIVLRFYMKYTGAVTTPRSVTFDLSVTVHNLYTVLAYQGEEVPATFVVPSFMLVP